MEYSILGDPGAASWGDRIFTGESLQQERESPWAFTLAERVPEASEIPLADWPEKFAGQSEGGISNASGTRWVRVNAQGLSRSCCKLSPVKILSPQLAAPGWPRMGVLLYMTYMGTCRWIAYGFWPLCPEQIYHFVRVFPKQGLNLSHTGMVGDACWSLKYFKMMKNRRACISQVRVMSLFIGLCLPKVIWFLSCFQ